MRCAFSFLFFLAFFTVRITFLFLIFFITTIFWCSVLNLERTYGCDCVYACVSLKLNNFCACVFALAINARARAYVCMRVCVYCGCVCVCVCAHACVGRAFLVSACADAFITYA